MIGIIDYNMGNLASVRNAFAKIGVEAEIVRKPEAVTTFDKIVLPGVGAFGDAMKHMKETGMEEAVKTFVQSGKPLIGICLGMQLLFDKSHEFGEHEGLGLIPGEVVLFDKSKMECEQKVPQMGWNKLFVTQENPLFDALGKELYLYFVHSYHVVPKDKADIIGETRYGYTFASAVHKENVYGFQPHPEKSHESGLKILDNFAKKV